MIGLVILAALCLGLAVALMLSRKHATEEKQKDTGTIVQLSNSWAETEGKLQEQKQVILIQIFANHQNFLISRRFYLCRKLLIMMNNG